MVLTSPPERLQPQVKWLYFKNELTLNYFKKKMLRKQNYSTHQISEQKEW